MSSGITSVEVTVETPGENQVIEISYEGQEIVQPPVTLSDHFSKQASKIDFQMVMEEASDSRDTDSEDMITDATSGDELDEASDSATTSNKWPWESVRHKLVEALTEVTVLSDVLAIATKECGKDAEGNPKRYMVLDGPVKFEPPEQKPYVALIAKKRSLEAPAKILMAGAEHLKQLQSESNCSGNSVSGNGSGSTSGDFHFELLRLRQNWRLKKVSNTILGDLSYGTAGSLYKQCSGVFEVTKADDEVKDSSKAMTSAVPEEKGRKSALRVTVPSVLEGISYIQVVIQKESEQLVSSNLSYSGTFGSHATEPVHWQQKLEAAQNALFCRELFSQLAKEAIMLQAPIPHLVVGNQISCSLYPDVQLLITLCHSTPGEEKKNPQSSQQQSREHNHMLEHSLHQLLRQAHQRNLNPDHGGLSSAPVGIAKRRRLAGPQAADKRSLLQMTSQETLLEQIIRQTHHFFLRIRTMFVLDTMSRELKDPLITCHWATMNSPTKTSVKVAIITSGYDAITRSWMVIHVGEKTLRVVCKDGRVFNFSNEPQELRDFILCQISQHQISGVQALARCTGWQVLSSSAFQLGCGPVEPLGNATGCLLASPAGDKYIAVRQNPSPQTSVYISTAPTKDFFAGAIVKDKKWENLPEAFQELRLDKMEGKNLLNKVELLMAALVTPAAS